MLSPIYPRPDNFLVKLLVLMTAVLTCSIISIGTVLFGPYELPSHRTAPTPTIAPSPTPPLTPTPQPSLPPVLAGSAPGGAAMQPSADAVPFGLFVFAVLVSLIFVALLGFAAFLRAQQGAFDRLSADQAQQMHALVQHLEDERFLNARRACRERYWREQHLRWRLDDQERHAAPSQREQDVPPLSGGERVNLDAGVVPARAPRHASRHVTASPLAPPLVRNMSVNGRWPDRGAGANGRADPFEEEGK